MAPAAGLRQQAQRARVTAQVFDAAAGSLRSDTTTLRSLLTGLAARLAEVWHGPAADDLDQQIARQRLTLTALCADVDAEGDVLIARAQQLRAEAERLERAACVAETAWPSTAAPVPFSG